MNEHPFREKQKIKFSYALVTPARDEEENIERLITSMILQTFLPLKWVIVSDGSTDRTDDIVKAYLQRYPWMELVRMPEHADRQFAAKVNCFNAGHARLQGLDYNIIGNLDADISFEPDYFEFLIPKFAGNPNLGVAGTPFVEDGKAYDYRFTNIEHVSGACQLFRKQCFEEIGGYLPIKGGGIDWVAVTTARMMGWKTQTFTEKTCTHHRKMGTGNTSLRKIWFKQGQKDYLFGYHPVWEIFRSIYQMGKSPKVIGGALLLLGYLWSSIQRTEVIACKEVTSFIRMEQMQRLRRIFF